MDWRKNTEYKNLKIILLTTEKIIETIWIPTNSSESVFFESIKSFHIEKIEGTWNIFCDNSSYVSVPQFPPLYVFPLDEDGLYHIVDDDKKYVILAEYMNKENSVYHNYYVGESAEIWIGKDSSNDIVCLDPYVTRQHALLEKTKNGWIVTDNNSANGVYVNDRAISEAYLSLGDVIFIVGIQIIVGTEYISINTGKKNIDIKLQKFNESMTLMDRESRFQKFRNENDEEYIFDRLPRQKKPFVEKTIQIEGPPVSVSTNSFPLLLRMGGSAVMGTSALLRGNPFMMLSSVMMPFLNHKYTEKEKKQYEELRHIKYSEYLSEKKQEILTEISEEEKYTRDLYPRITDLLNFTYNSEILWSRRCVDDDFLNIKVGIGDIEPKSKIEYPKQRFCLNEDDLEDDMIALAEKPRFLHDVPIAVSLIENYVTNIKGNQKQIIQYLIQLIIQLVILHSYDEMKLILFTDQKTLSEIDWVLSLPHVWNNQKTMRFIATNIAEACLVTKYLENQVLDDIEKKDVRLDETLKKRPYYVIIATNKKLINSLEFVSRIMQADHNCGISVIAAYDTPPKDCSLQIDVSKGKGVLKHLGKAYQEDLKFDIEEFDRSLISKCMRNISNIKLKEYSKEFQLPQSLSFLEMYDVTSINQLQVEKRWRENNPVKSLAAPIGVGADGNILSLDMHEKYHGPHGLVAGTTGSGKSQFLLTYILSMAISYHPDEVSFILIDYKGGDLTNAFVDEQRGIHLPHVVGTLTNLDKDEVNHALLSLESELLRRERIFNQAKSDVNEATMDIYSYQKLYRQGKIKQPLPHLFIIVDEFAELKLKQKEFMKELISISRVGRSLGVHLILATQKPGGIVDEQIRSNSKAKICLKVQDKTDSIDVLKRPEAVELKTTGRFYMQIGYNESFELGQSGWCGAQYFENVQLNKKKSIPIEFIDVSGQVYYKVSNSKKDESTKSQLVSIVQKLNDYAIEKNIQTKNIWEPPLKKILDVQKLDYHSYENPIQDYKIPVGILDDPENQSQRTLTIDLNQIRNMAIIGLSKSGKTTLVQTILYQISRYYNPNQVQFYVLNRTGKKLIAFDIVPHCGGVVKLEDNISEDIFKYLNKLIDERRQQFERLELDDYESVNRIEPIPMVLIVIDDLAAVLSLEKGREYVGIIKEYLKIAATYGIKFIITCSNLKQFHTISEEVNCQICLRLKDIFDYSTVYGGVCKNLPSNIPGRGLIDINDRVLLFQTAAVATNLEEAQRNQLLKKQMKDISLKYVDGVKAHRLQPDIGDISYQEFCNKFEEACLPLGFNKTNNKPVALWLKQWKMLCAYLGTDTSKKVFFENLIIACSKYKMETVIIKSTSHQSYFEQSTALPSNIQFEELNQKSMEKLLGKLQKRSEIRNRFMESRQLSNESEKDCIEVQHYIENHTVPIVYIFEDLKDIICYPDIEVVKMLYMTINQINSLLNIHFVVGLNPNEFIKFPIPELEYVTNDDMMALFCGGNLDKQNLVDFSVDTIQESNADIQWIMRYRKKNYIIKIPYLIENEVTIDKDDLSIF